MFFSDLAAIAFLPFPTAMPDQMPLQFGTILHVISRQGRPVCSWKTQTSGNNLTIPSNCIGTEIFLPDQLEGFDLFKSPLHTDKCLSHSILEKFSSLASVLEEEDVHSLAGA